MSVDYVFRCESCLGAINFDANFYRDPDEALKIARFIDYHATISSCYDHAFTMYPKSMGDMNPFKEIGTPDAILEYNDDYFFEQKAFENQDTYWENLKILDKLISERKGKK